MILAVPLVFVDKKIFLCKKNVQVERMTLKKIWLIENVPNNIANKMHGTIFWFISKERPRIFFTSNFIHHLRVYLAWFYYRLIKKVRILYFWLFFSNSPSNFDLEKWYYIPWYLVLKSDIRYLVRQNCPWRLEKCLR